jgi:anhydro-N-acetylmuramic acid kinase
MNEHRDYLLSIGVMTGNSLDGIDVVLSLFDERGNIEDLKAHSVGLKTDLGTQLRNLRDVINQCQGDMNRAVSMFDQNKNQHGTFDIVQTSYIRAISQAIKELVKLAKEDASVASRFDLEKIDVIGFHGQTCAHFPPSIAKTKDPEVVYTCQIGDGQMLADLTGITVVYDFRSDDLMNGGEAAPLAPVHHQHLAEQMKRQGRFPVAFCNAGNTGNFTAISLNSKTNELTVIGWDTGPFNNYPDKLMQGERNEHCDRDGRIGEKGRVNQSLLRLLFDTAVVTNDGLNFLLQPPPKSSDPQWYKLIPELSGKLPVDGDVLSFEDRIRTAEYFSAYAYVWALTMIPEHIQMPNHFALCGGGWKNPISRSHFAELLCGDLDKQVVLTEHKDAFEKVRARGLRSAGTTGNQSGGQIHVELSENYGFDGTAMEARIFADAAVCRIKGEAFTRPSTTGVKSDTTAGIIRFPGGKENNATPALLDWLSKYKSRDLTLDRPGIFDRRWGRASRGWHSICAVH